MSQTSIPRLKACSDGELISKTLLEHGVLIVEGFLEASILEAFNREMDGPLAQERPDRKFLSPIYDHFFGSKTRHLTGLTGRSEIFREQIMQHPLYLELCEQILLPNCASYQLNYGHIFEIAPGAKAQALHRDGDCWSYLPSDFNVEVASILALTEFTEANGATLVIPGSHRWPRNKTLNYADAVPAEMSAGSALLYLGATAHAAGSNITTADLRRGMHVSYCLGWLRTEENNYLAAPINEVRNYSKTAQKLLGYAPHDAAPNGGCLGVFSMLDPMELMADGKL
ncbi:phytanoyl-CoA dioxygenase family protein [Parahaliea sp. F7430]|uniref:Phytanoyl-CoA dioxygenase family protein n=1 Tax=Sediminihaliea albiluteola TaxID=2758564 RepID=A0A7W2TW58_9GAMM|nr:phytanoyl-CoA dioxygenase family protein [Sediminihaliea albiluteola]MBA6413070.1 phytanoyl-CoA dioxygenase family protein [Sediminihaliea albiluteola]